MFCCGLSSQEAHSSHPAAYADIASSCQSAESLQALPMCSWTEKQSLTGAERRLRRPPTLTSLLRSFRRAPTRCRGRQAWARLFLSQSCLTYASACFGAPTRVGMMQAKQDLLKKRVEEALKTVKADAAAGGQPDALKASLDTLKLELVEFEKVRAT